MSAWWSNLSTREQALVGIALSLVIVLVLSFVVIRPFGHWQRSAQQRVDAANSTYQIVAAAAATGSGEVERPRGAEIPLRNAITQVASEMGVEIIRIGSENDGKIEIQPAPVSGEVLFGWLERLKNDFGIEVVVADVSRGEGAVVNAQILVLERN